ncbi:hypothetical protein GCM10007967_08420 [Xylanimonas ulmi]
MAYAGGRDGEVSGLAMLAALVGWTLAGLLVLRRRHPVAVALAASAAAVVLPLDSFAALLALTWVIATARVRTAVLCTAAVTAATAVALWRDAARAPGDRVFAVYDQTTGVLTHAPEAASFWVAGVLLLAAAVSAGLARRFRAAASDSQEAQATAVAVLHDKTLREDERELIAREVHDTVAHHIASIAMQASAFEVTQQNEAAKVAARQVRSSAQQAIAELRALMTALRTGTGVGTQGATLEDLVPLLDGLRERGLTVAGTVFVSDAAAASQALARATFRIVQESLTNALKHAPNAPVELSVRAGRADGVQIRVANTVEPGAAPGPGTRSGTVIMAERAAALGGTFHAGVEAGRYVVVAHLPWREATA